MKNALAGASERFARWSGLRVIPEWRLEQRAFALHLKDLYAHLGVRTVLDVGANRGQFHDFLRNEVGFTGHIHSFEPLSHLAEGLRQKAGSDPNWSVHTHALGAEAGAASINVMASDTFSSMRVAAASAPDEFKASARVVRVEDIEIKTLDDVVDAHAIDLSSAYLKVDTQGFDLEVLAGGPRAMAALPAMQLELSIRRIYDGVPGYRDVLALLEQRGFAISGLYPISIDQRMRAVEFDCVLVRDDPAT